jgi:hypothetical protein
MIEMKKKKKKKKLKDKIENTSKLEDVICNLMYIYILK